LLGYLKGGIHLSQEQQLRFSVEESVWFQKGQEVSELLSISLEPDIAIHEHEQYISIRGALQLTGEYKIDNEAEEHEQFNFANVRYVNEVHTREDGVSIVNHRFPVDITIPNNRIENLDEVYVSIESFDYEIPELKCLKLVADLSISGILNDQSQPAEAKAEDTRQEEAVFEALFRGPQSQTWDTHEESSPIQTSTTHPFSSFYQEEETTGEDVDKLSPVDIKLEEVREEEQEKEKEVELQSTSSPDVLEVVAIGSEEVEKNQEDDREEDWQVERQEGQQDDREEDWQVEGQEGQQDDREEDWQVKGQEGHQDEQEDLYNPFVVEVRKEEQETIEPQEVQYTFFSKTEDSDSSENQAEPVEVATREEEKPKDSHYLTSLFARDGEDDFSRLKMCIVQQGDTLELICERYELSVQQILRVNDLQANKDVYEGQILYIPSLSTSK
jgi:stage VI sporulation protein D